MKYKYILSQVLINFKQEVEILLDICNHYSTQLFLALECIFAFLRDLPSFFFWWFYTVKEVEQWMVAKISSKYSPGLPTLSQFSDLCVKYNWCTLVEKT